MVLVLDWLGGFMGLAAVLGAITVFRGAFASAGGIFILGGGGWSAGCHSMGFRHFPNYFLIS